jgi:hypothetical protein
METIFKIKGEEKDKINEIELYLEDCDVDGILLMGRDRKGKIQTIMRFRDDGAFMRSTNIHLEGLKSDKEGRIFESDHF